MNQAICVLYHLSQAPSSLVEQFKLRKELFISIVRKNSEAFNARVNALTEILARVAVMFRGLFGPLMMEYNHVVTQ